MASPSLEPARHRLAVRGELVFAVRDGKTRLTRSYAEPPLQVQRVLYLDDSVPDMAFLFLLNPTPGLFQGDVQTLSVNAGPGTRSQLATPSATKIFAMPDREARQTLELTLAQDSYLEYLPEPLIPFRGSRLVQRTIARLDTDATLVLGEILAPGRVARGESFAYHSLDRRLTVYGPANLPIHHESSRLAPATGSPLGLSLLNQEFPVTGSLLVAAPGRNLAALKEKLEECLAAATKISPNSKVGLSTLPHGSGLAIKTLCQDAQTTRSLLRASADLARRHFLGAGASIPRHY